MIAGNNTRRDRRECRVVESNQHRHGGQANDEGMTGPERETPRPKKILVGGKERQRDVTTMQRAYGRYIIEMVNRIERGQTGHRKCLSAQTKDNDIANQKEERGKTQEIRRRGESRGMGLKKEIAADRKPILALPHSLGTQSVALEASSIELSVVQNSLSVALRLLQLF